MKLWTMTFRNKVGRHKKVFNETRFEKRPVAIAKIKKGNDLTELRLASF